MKAHNDLAAGLQGRRQTRKSTDAFIYSTTIPILQKYYGVSAFGSRLAFYEMRNCDRVVMPIRTRSGVEPDAASEMRWNQGLREDEGWLKMSEVVSYLKTLVGAQFKSSDFTMMS